jgi:hypothetical protein
VREQKEQEEKEEGEGNIKNKKGTLSREKKTMCNFDGGEGRGERYLIPSV